MTFKTSRGALTAALLVAVAVVLGGCATGPRVVRTEVTTFDAWSTLPAGRDYVFERTLEYQNSLEMQTYEDIVRDELKVRGFELAKDPARAALAVTLRPSVMTTQVQVRDRFADPFYGPWGGFGRGYGRGWYGPGWGGFYGPGPYWGGPWGYNDYVVDVYRRRLEIDIDSRAAPVKRYFEGRVENTGTSDSLQGVMPYLIRALFTDFPGNSGQTRRIDVPVEPPR